MENNYHFFCAKFPSLNNILYQYFSDGRPGGQVGKISWDPWSILEILRLDCTVQYILLLINCRMSFISYKNTNVVKKLNLSITICCIAINSVRYFTNNILLGSFSSPDKKVKCYKSFVVGEITWIPYLLLLHKILLKLKAYHYYNLK